jgi:hypothetical protein
MLRLSKIASRRSSTLILVLLTVAPVAAAQETGAGAAATGSKTTAARAQDTARHVVTDADRDFVVPAVFATSAPLIDGRLDDPAWEAVTPITQFTQSQPNEGAATTERTEVRVMYDAEFLYVSAMMWDSQPDQMVATVLRRDESHNNNDAFAVTLDTYHDHRNGFFFETNAHGALYDAQIIGEGGGGGVGGGGNNGTSFNPDWDAVWYAAGQLTDEGWSVEIAIPFWALRFDRTSMEAWGINFRRQIRRKTESAYWAPVSRQFNATRLSLSGMLVGMEEVERPRNLQVKPYALGDVGQFPAGPESNPYDSHNTEWGGDIGGDVKWSISPNWTLDGTINTDFAQVEADDVQVNLTRFPLFFPEKREFFLENAGLFQFGSSSGSVGPRVIGFHSRRIGIAAGDEVPILAGARLTGKSGGWNLGGLNMQTRSVDDLGVPTENHTVMRVRRDLGSRSSIGALFTNRQSGSSEYNRTAGFDGRWALNDQTTIDGWVMKTETPGTGDESEWAGALSANWASPEWQVSTAIMDVGEGFNPGLGFVNRTGLRSFNANAFWTPYFPDSKWIRNLGPHITFQYLTDREGRLLSRFVHLDYDMFLKRGDKLSIAHNRRFERLDLPFEIVPGVVIPVGDYEFDDIQLEAQSDMSRVAWVRALYTFGTFWDGRKKNWDLSAGFRLGARFNARVAANLNAIELSGGDFKTTLLSTRLAYDFNTRLFLSGLLQYDNLTDQFLSNVRLRYNYEPLSDIFLVYNESRLTEDPTLIDRAIILKFTKLLRL